MVTIALLVPDITSNVANLSRLYELEKKCLSFFSNSITYSQNGDYFLLSLKGEAIEKDDRLRCHSVILKILFQILNVKN